MLNIRAGAGSHSLRKVTKIKLVLTYFLLSKRETEKGHIIFVVNQWEIDRGHIISWSCPSSSVKQFKQYKQCKQYEHCEKCTRSLERGATSIFVVIFLTYLFPTTGGCWHSGGKENRTTASGWRKTAKNNLSSVEIFLFYKRVSLYFNDVILLAGWIRFAAHWSSFLRDDRDLFRGSW